MKELPKAYVASEHEPSMLKLWEQSGFSNPDNLPGERTEPFCIVMPPPNVTGTLHLGHATILALEDLMIRFERMRGKKALWIPGTDHAAIATQTKVEKLLRKSTGKTRHEFGRELFLTEVRKFAQESHDTIVGQVKAMGSSCDWSREAYTLDEKRNLAVRTIFKMMYDDGLIYRGTRVVNWDPEYQTTIADDEVLTKETTAKLYTFKYDADFPIAISTTRPETKYGDTGVAVHPSDERYQKYIGQTFSANFCGQKISIRVVADEAVDPAFGTGALGVTPAHSKIDEEIARKNNLPTVQVIGMDGKMMSGVGAVAGLKTIEARAKTVEYLAEHGLIIKEEDVPQALPVSERGGGIVEELPMLQWFINVNKPITGGARSLGFGMTHGGTTDAGMTHSGNVGKTLKELSIEAVKSGKTKIVPERFEKTYYHWMENLRDWCISRQIWFGHQIPVWYRGQEINKSINQEITEQETYCGVEAPKGEGWVQDPDSLDTWFSSGLWTFSTLGWPEKTKDLEFYHPTSVLETGYDILFFWVARMILMTTYALGEVPFHNVYLHGLVRDEQGRKMSKSLGNGIDPMETNAKYGTDATRLSLVIGSSPGNDMKLSEQKVEGFRNFANKLWNISRFVLSLDSSAVPQNENTGAVRHPEQSEGSSHGSLADKWILARLAEVTSQVTENLASYRFSQAGELLRDFTWSDFADWYLEIAKVQMKKETIQDTRYTKDILHHVLKTVLKLWHPFMPFVTETIWQNAGFGGVLMVEVWPDVARRGLSPKPQGTVPSRSQEFEKLRDLITTLRNLRAEAKLPAGKRVKARIEKSELAESQAEVIKALAMIESIDFSGSGVALDLAGTIDVAAEKSRLEKEIADLERYFETQTAKLANADFVARAPAPVIEKEKAKLAETKTKIETLKAQLKNL
ncbi:MAG: valine--tRNA ligase [bacterium]